MKVRHDDTGIINDETRSQRRSATLAIVIAKIAEKILERRAGRELRHVSRRTVIDDGCRRNIHHRRGQRLCLVGKAVGPLGGTDIESYKHDRRAGKRRKRAEQPHQH